MRSVILFVFIISAFLSEAQKNYGLKALNFAEYKRSVEKDPNKALVDLETFIPGIILDIRYATTNNFVGERIYNFPKAFARKPVAVALRRVQGELQQQGLAVKIFDAYRPYKATVKFYEVYKDTTYVASPYRGSRHNRGCAIDMTLVDIKTGKELAMPTGYDSFSKNAWPSTPVKDPVTRRNRALIIDVMQKHGFKVNSSEWWHFDFVGWKKYEVLDIEFEELIKQH